MSLREELRLYVDPLPEQGLPIADRLLAGLSATARSVARSLALAPDDDEQGEDDRDGGMSEVAEESARGEWIAYTEVKR